MRMCWPRRALINPLDVLAPFVPPNMECTTTILTVTECIKHAIDLIRSDRWIQIQTARRLVGVLHDLDVVQEAGFVCAVGASQEATGLNGVHANVAGALCSWAGLV